MKLLDLYCGAGGAGMGYHRAGFDVTGVDLAPQPRYPFAFVQGDALEYLAEHGREFDAVHASPPCQRFSTMRRGLWQEREHPDLIAPTRELLRELGRPYIIENVEGARSELLEPIRLCGTGFGLGLADGSQLRRHRYFELSGFDVLLVPPCAHHREVAPVPVYGGGQNGDYHNPPRNLDRRRARTVGVYGNAGGSSVRDGIRMHGISERREAMGIDWMNAAELSEAIPPAYTEWIGRALRAEIGGSNNA